MEKSDVLHDDVPQEGPATGNGDIRGKLTAHRDLIVLFAIGSIKCQVTINRFYVMPTNLHKTLRLAPFYRAGCMKATHYVHNKVKITLDSGEVIDITISVVSNHLYYVKVNILSPGINPDPIDSHNVDHMK